MKNKLLISAILTLTAHFCIGQTTYPKMFTDGNDTIIESVVAQIRYANVHYIEGLSTCAEENDSLNSELKDCDKNISRLTGLQKIAEERIAVKEGEVAALEQKDKNNISLLADAKKKSKGNKIKNTLVEIGEGILISALLFLSLQK